MGGIVGIIYSLYIYAPIILWPLVFIVFRDLFIYAMLISTTILGLSSMIMYRDRIPLSLRYIDLVYGVAAAVLLYLLFYMGNIFLDTVGLGGNVTYVYRLIESIAVGYLIPLALIWIGFMEELYWRGGLIFGVIFKPDNTNERSSRSFKRAFISAIYYTTVHISTLNIALIAGAFVAGSILTFLAYYRNVSVSTIAHILWLELLVVIIPLR